MTLTTLSYCKLTDQGSRNPAQLFKDYTSSKIVFEGIMNISNLLEKTKETNDQADQILVISGVTWQQYLDIDNALGSVPGLRFAYCQGLLEIMTLSSRHEQVKKMIARLLETYALVKNIDLHGYGSTTQRDEATQGGLEPDESYYVGELTTIPNLAIEVIITSGGINKLQIYQNLGIEEIWFWQDQQLSVYLLQEGEYQLSNQSKLFPDLDLALLIKYMQPDHQSQAVKGFYHLLLQ